MNLVDEMSDSLKNVSLDGFEPKEPVQRGEKIIGVLPDDLKKLYALHEGMNERIR